MSLRAVPGCSAPAASPAVDVRGLGRVFGDKEALRGVFLEIAAGEIHALVGPNGAGKTTLLRILSGFTAPSEGTVRVAGRDPARGGRAHRAALGIVPAGDRSFYLRISALENLVFFGRLHGLRKRAAVDRSLELLDQVGLAEAARVPVRSYSQGMKKRLSIARGLLADPCLLLVDEATHDLDPAGARDVRKLVAQRATSGTALLWATQRIEEIRGFAARVTLLDAGRVRFSGLTEEFLSRGEDAEAAFLAVTGSEGRR